MAGGKAERIAVSGFAIAFVIISLYLGTIIRNNRIFFIALATYIGVLPYIKGDIKAGITAYAASAVLSLILIPNKLYAGIYVIFGVYPLIKLICEKMKTYKEFLLKYFWFNLSVGIAYALFKNIVLVGEFLSTFKGIILLVFLLEFSFFIYDYVFTKFILFVQDKILYKR